MNPKTPKQRTLKPKTREVVFHDFGDTVGKTELRDESCGEASVLIHTRMASVSQPQQGTW